MPARSKGGGDLGGVRIAVSVDAERASLQFKEARHEVNSRTREGLRLAGERVALPEAKLRAGNLKVAGVVTASTLIVRPTTRDAYLTTSLKGKAGRAVGLQEFGGVVSTLIVPKNRQAVVVNGQPVAQVATPRHYTGRRFMTSAVAAKKQDIAEAVRDEILKAFEPEFGIE